ncbi:MAG TPA: YciI family protein [Polyangiales bacterium]|nr:YciI family protein [Polyangiales bacterium]
MILLRANRDSEAGKIPSQKLLAEMGAFNEELVKAGIMLGGAGLKPSSSAKRVRFSGSDRKVVDGPFSETKELLAGCWLWQVKSMDEAIAWVKRIPNCDAQPGDVNDVEIRPLFESTDFGDNFTPELREQEERLRAQMAQQRG